MNRLGRPLLAIAAASLVWAAPGHAYFEDLSVDPRAVAMGNAGGATVIGVGAYYWNPAALSNLITPEALFDYSSPYSVPELSVSTLALGRRVGPAGAALAWHRLRVREVYSEDQFAAAAGFPVPLPLSRHRLEAGASLRLGRVAFQPFDDPTSGATIDYGSKTGVDADLGLRWVTPWRVDLSWVGRNLLAPRYDVVEGGGAGKAPRLNELGLAYRWNPQSTASLGWRQTDGGGSGTLNAGIEIWFFDVFALRSGFMNTQDVIEATTFDGLSQFNFTGGFGVRHRGIEVNGSVTTHADLGASYRGGLRVGMRPRGVQ